MDLPAKGETRAMPCYAQARAAAIPFSWRVLSPGAGAAPDSADARVSASRNRATAGLRPRAWLAAILSSRGEIAASRVLHLQRRARHRVRLRAPLVPLEG